MVSMKVLELATVLGFSAVLALGSCGGSSDGGSCPATAPCGGDIVGTWTIQSACLVSSMMDGGCPGSTIKASSLTYTGSAVYRADLSYALNGVLAGSITATFPTSCLMNQGQVLTCAQVQDLLTTQADPGLSFSCTGTSPCTCVETLTGVVVNDVGTYTVGAGGLLTLNASDGRGPEQDDYCVKQNTLTLSPHEDGSMMQQFKGSIVLTKN